MDSELEEIKKTAAHRCPPGDKWTCDYDGATDTVYNSLTECLEAIYQGTGSTQFFMDSRKGLISVVDLVKKPKVIIPEKKWSLYGE